MKNPLFRAFDNDIGGITQGRFLMVYPEKVKKFILVSALFSGTKGDAL